MEENYWCHKCGSLFSKNQCIISMIANCEIVRCKDCNIKVIQNYKWDTVENGEDNFKK